jgi:hypothetical protein
VANKVYQARETGLNFRPSGAGGSGVNFALNGLGVGAGVISDRQDFGTASRSRVFEWRAALTGNSTVVGEKVELYLVTSDGTNADGGLPSSAGAVTDVNRLRNLMHLGTVEVDQTGTGKLLVASGVVELYARYGQLLAWNGTSDALDSGNTHSVMLTPVPDEIQ